MLLFVCFVCFLNVVIYSKSDLKVPDIKPKQNGVQ